MAILQWFESLRGRQSFASVAEMAQQESSNLRFARSSHALGVPSTILGGITQQVEFSIDNRVVSGSNPDAATINDPFF